jgi:outer membrane protein assembly factor BamD
MEAKEIYAQGKENLTKEKYFQAIKDFAELEKKYPYGDYTDKGQLAEIYALYQNNSKDDLEAALKACDRFIRLHPRHKHVDYAYYMRGMIYYAGNFTTAFKYFPIDRSLRESSKAKDAFAAFKKLLEKFPDSKYAYDARQRMLELREQIANLEYHIALDYYNNKVYVAAANRAGTLVTDMPETCAAHEALKLLVQIYRKMGQKELEAKTIQIIKDNNVH